MPSSEWYLDRSHMDFAILTNGRLWRLIPRVRGPQQRRFQTYLECDLPTILDAWLAAERSGNQPPTLIDEFLRFYLFFSSAGFRKTENRKPLAKRAVEGSSEYRLGVGEGLKERTFEALRLCIEGFLTFEPNRLNATTDLADCREQSFILLYRLLFIMYAEDRRLLPYRVNGPYTNNRSLGRHRDEISGRLDRIRDGRDDDYSRKDTSIWADLLDLFDLVDRGRKTYAVPAYNGGLFDPEAHLFLVEKRIPDWYLARVIDQLGRAPDPNEPSAGLFRVDYLDLAIQHLGGIYEGLLELHPHHATERMIVVSRRVQGRVEERTQPASQSILEGFEQTDISYRPGSIYLETEKGERRATGSYYTPDHVVDHIVEQTLGPLCVAVSNQLARDIADADGRLPTAAGKERTRLAATLEKLRRDFDDRILRLRVLDPAMGSGHFLIRACQYLAEEIATHPYTGDEGGEASVAYWKRRVVEQSLHGVDMNELAVELAKLALWLETVAVDEPLTFLDHHLRHGNSLVGARTATLGVLPQEVELLTNKFVRQVEEQLPHMLKPLAEIRGTPSQSSEQVKSKERLYRELDRRREPFQMAADIWCSTFVGETGAGISPEQYQTVLDVLSKPAQFKRLTEEPWFQATLAAARQAFVRCFHWELEFPEVFFDEHGRRANVGFDAIIGNPPYDVLSEAETGRDLSALRAFLEHEPVYQPSFVGKNNLYKLFICRALELLADGGRLGFITPMAVLGDEQASEIRRKLVEVGRFTGIEALPQKDNPKRRIFPEAKLSTAVFTLVKDRSPDASSQSFQSRVHPDRFIESGSPGLTLSTASIPLYDPSNFTIVSCSQADWDLATKIMSSGRMGRLRHFAEFFQGEVNETNERKRGTLTDDRRKGKLVTRGASICLYVLRPASQGDDLLIDVESFLERKGEDTKAYHHRHPRVGLQESSPQNNFRRIIAAYIPAGEFCNHTVNYCPQSKVNVDLELILALLNSKLADWYFRLGSTNAHVSHYQLYNLPCPNFAETQDADDRRLEKKSLDALRAGDTERAFEHLQAALARPPFPLSIRAAIVEAVRRITEIETARGEIPRTARSALDPTAQPSQDLTDRLLYSMAGLTEEDIEGLEERLGAML
ncbi:MAG: N-6 DNA methylase [Planctomycetes bacterium]|nr:N-6 DNA methylase [Planctomycetota bacterium]